MHRFSPYKGAVWAAESRQTFFGPMLEAHPRLPTTMTVVDDMIAAGAAVNGKTVIALEQTHGQGSGGREWVSGKGNAMFSRAVEIQPGEHGQEIEMIAACAVAEILQDLLPPERTVSIKYPNDVLVDDIKIAGCLVPPTYDLDADDGATRLVNLGVGVNLKVAPELPDGRPTTSLATMGIKLSIDNFMDRFDVKFAEIIGHYRAERDFNAILTRMGFLDSDGLMNLRRNGSGEVVRGAYAGFRAMMFGKRPLNMIRLNVRGVTGDYAIHKHSLVNTPAPSAYRRRPLRLASLDADA